MTTEKQLEANRENAKLGGVKTEQKLMQKYTPEEALRIVLESAVPNGDLKGNLKNLGENLLPIWLHGGKKEQKEIQDEFNKKALEVLMTLETDTHVALMESFYSQYRGLAREFSKQLIKDYDCNTHVERALAEIITNAYIRIIDNSRRLNNDLGNPNGGHPINENRTKYLAMISKQIDRANRQFLNALITLKQLKAPTVEMNIKTKNTFVAQNQQINAGNPMESNQNKNNEAK